MSEKTVQLNKKFFLSLTIILICFFLDRVSKIYVIELFTNNEFKQQYINSFANIILIWNKGIAFGFFESENFIYKFITLIITLIVLFLNYLIFKTKKIIEIICFSAIIGGALGNLFDRFYYKAVPDFIDLHYGSFHWFTFNVSDICISVGIIMLILFDIFQYPKNKNND